MDYSLTERGRELAALLLLLVTLVAEHAEESVSGDTNPNLADMP